MSIELTSVYKSYPTRQGPTSILKNINLNVGKGEHVGILGQNGSGKSTLIRILGGSERPTKGTVFRGMSVSWPLAFGGAFLGALTGIDNIRFVCRLYGVNPDEKLPFVQDFTELGKYLREPVKSYSSGMRARLAFAVSMAVDFDCYLIDEIVAVGDDRFQRKCQYELFEKRANKAMLLVSHSADFIRDHCHKASVLTAGELTNFDNVDDAYRFYASHELAMQPHMAETAQKPIVHLPENAVKVVADAFYRGASGEDFDEFLASLNFDQAPVFDSCDVVGRLSSTGEDAAAIAAAEFLTIRRQNEPLFWITLGDLYCQRRQHVPGVEAYREALRLDPSSYWGNRNLATEFFNVGRYEDAIPVYEVAIAVAPSSASRLELQLRWLDARTLLDRPPEVMPFDVNVPANLAVVVDQSCLALYDGRSARMAVAGLVSDLTDLPTLECIFRTGDRSWRANPVLARNSIRRMANFSDTLAFGFVHYAPLDDTDSEIEFEIRQHNQVLYSGVEQVRRIGGAASETGSPLAAARLADAAHNAEASAFLYGMSEQAGADSDIVRFVENLIHIGLYDEAEFHLRRWLGSKPYDHPDRAFAVDLVCVEIARSRLPGWRTELDKFLQAEGRQANNASVLANLGHASVDDGDLDNATKLYREASSVAAGHEIIHFARGIHTAKFVDEVSHRGPQAPNLDHPIEDNDIVHLFACDAKYFQRFAPTLVESSRDRCGRSSVVIHAHIVDPDSESLELANRLRDKFGLRYTTENTPTFVEQDSVKRAFFTCARFLVAPELLRDYQCPVLITEADCLMNWRWPDLLRYIDGSDIGHVRSSGWNWVPWTKIPAGIFLFAPTKAGLELADYIARFIRYAFEREGSGNLDLWTVDQVALWLSEAVRPQGMRSIHLPMASVLTLATGDKGNVLAD